jgi:hypothetical protein
LPNAAILDFESKRVELRFKRLANRLFAFMDWPELAHVGLSGLSVFIDSVGQDPTDPDSRAWAGLENEFVEWLLLDYVDADVGATAASMFLASPDNDLADWEVASLQQWADSAPRLYEIVERLSDSRLLLRDVMSNDVYLVVSPQMSASALKWSLYVARLLRVDDVYTVGAMAALLPRRMLGYLWRMLGHVYRGMKAQGYSGDIDDFLKGSALNLMKIMRAFSVTDDGDDEDDDDDAGASRSDTSLACLEVQMAGADANAALEAFSALAPVRPAGDGYVWVRLPRKDDFAGVAMYGRSDIAYIKPVDGGVRIYCTGRGVPASVADALRRLSRRASVLGGGRRPQGSRQEAAKRVRKPEGHEAKEALEVIDGLLSELSRNHYATWVDRPMPVLRGETPRTATRMHAGRRLVEELLKDIEYHEDLKRRAGLPWVDVEAMCRGPLAEALSSETAPADKHEAAVRAVEALLDEKMRLDGYSSEQVYHAAKMWNDFAAMARPRIVHAPIWAAAAEYASATAQKEPVTQASIASKYQVSVSSVSQRSRQISRALRQRARQ